MVYDRVDRFKAFGGAGDDIYLFSDQLLIEQFKEFEDTIIDIRDTDGDDTIVFYTDSLVTDFSRLKLTKTSTGVELAGLEGFFTSSPSFTIRLNSQIDEDGKIEEVAFARLVGETQLEIYSTLRIDEEGGILFQEKAGSSQDDRITGQNSADKILGKKGSDKIKGLAGDDTLSGGGGSDTISGGSGNDLARGGGGADVLRGNGNADRLVGNGGADKLIGGKGLDTLLGGAGSDTLKGNGGADVLRGGKGRDELTGGSGADKFVFRVGDSQDVITDFEQGRDRIIVESGANEFEGLNIKQIGTDVRIIIGNTGVTIVNDEVHEFSAADFVFS